MILRRALAVAALAALAGGAGTARADTTWTRISTTFDPNIVVLTPGARRFDEARALVAGLARTAPDAGETRYLQAQLAFLDGEVTEEQARELTVSGTRRFARRQDSWFRKDDRITWVRWDDPDRVARALDRLGSASPG